MVQCYAARPIAAAANAAVVRATTTRIRELVLFTLLFLLNLCFSVGQMVEKLLTW
jgi:hypothetical protein